ncbi:death domain-containing protein CRADD [Corythoichthys intestinalis]|uniref:death domain-containing protein CRADD n=1 Tax=Corythoichthys intestinalis TaxID=161448 RepID=UPI0025A53518|nr:death domain-containing protein CRADD [Corythoichthys intestinalis]XP_057710774.1 death domain-containing protein CRADD [Corythoichthys intestinalis]
MEPVHRRVLQKLRLYLCEELLVSEGVLSFLYQEEVVTAAQANDVLAESSERKRCLKLLDLLPQRGPGAFAAFLGALDDFAWVRQRLLREEQTLRNVRSPSPESPTSADADSGVEIPSDRQLSRLASALGAEWESVATDLGVSPAALFRCRADHALCCRDAALAALLLWRRSQGKKATARRLRQSLRAAGVHPSVLDDVATP